jgi:nucleoside-diphosphate-sugar epimerase
MMSNFKNNDNILIVGGTGFIGSHLTERCLKDTPHVTVLGLRAKNSKLPINEENFLEVDIRNKEQLNSVLKNRSFDYVFNLAGFIDHMPYFNGGREVIESHFNGLMNLIDCLDKESLKSFVQIGSSDEYGNAPAPQKETIRETAISPYSLAKTAASHFIQTLYRTEKFPGVVLRLFLVYGPGQDTGRFLPQIIEGCLKGAEFKTSKGEQLRDFCYIEDAVEAMIKAALNPEARGCIVNIASGIPVSVKEVIEKVMRIVGAGTPLWGVYPYREGENMELYADIALAKELLDWRPCTSLEEGLKKTVDFYRNLNTGGKL